MKFILILILLSTSCFGQLSKIDSLTSVNCNKNWIAVLESKVTKDEKLRMIIKKIVSDSIVPNESFNHKITIAAGDGESINTIISRKTTCKIIFILSKKNKFFWLDLNSSPHLLEIIKHLTIDNVDSITIFKDDEAMALFGTRAMCGVVNLKVKDQKLKIILRKLYSKKYFKKTN